MYHICLETGLPYIIGDIQLDAICENGCPPGFRVLNSYNTLAEAEAALDMMLAA